MHKCIIAWICGCFMFGYFIYAQIFDDSPPSALDTHAQLAQDLFSLRADLRASLSRGRLCGSRAATGTAAAGDLQQFPASSSASVSSDESNCPALNGNLSDSTDSILTAANSELRSINEYSRTVSARYVLSSLFAFARSRTQLHLLSFFLSLSLSLHESQSQRTQTLLSFAHISPSRALFTPETCAAAELPTHWLTFLNRDCSLSNFDIFCSMQDGECRMLQKMMSVIPS